MNNNDKRGAGAFGEPWKAVHALINHQDLRLAFADGGDRRDDWDALENERLLRGVACVNACAGIVDPAEAVAVLREVAATDPGSLGADEEVYCWFCRVPTYAYSNQPAIQHAGSCLWARIRRALGMTVPPAAPAGEHWQAEQPYA